MVLKMISEEIITKTKLAAIPALCPNVTAFPIETILSRRLPANEGSLFSSILFCKTLFSLDYLMVVPVLKRLAYGRYSFQSLMNNVQ